MEWRWPFVSLLAFELLRSTRDEELRRLQAELEKEQARSKELLDVVLELKLAGAAAPRRQKEPTPTARPRPRSRIQQAIDENPLASNRPDLRDHLDAWATKELAKRPADVDEDEWEDRIIDRLRTWHVVGENPDDDEEEDDLFDEIGHDDSAVPIG
jgi:hypothetical protein